MNRNGKVLTDSQTVEFEAGKTANVTFAEPKAESPAPPPANPMPPKTTRIRVRMPDGAALYVEGRPWATPVVQTPPLDPNRTHYYQLTVETIRDGRRAFVDPRSRVPRRAGRDRGFHVRPTRPGERGEEFAVSSASRSMSRRVS